MKSWVRRIKKREIQIVILEYYLPKNGTVRVCPVCPRNPIGGEVTILKGQVRSLVRSSGSGGSGTAQIP